MAAFKPVVTGLDEPAASGRATTSCSRAPPAGGQAPEEVAPYRFGPPLSPHYAAELAGETIEPARLVEARAARRRRRRC